MHACHDAHVKVNACACIPWYACLKKVILGQQASPIHTGIESMGGNWRPDDSLKDVPLLAGLLKQTVNILM